MGQFFTTWPSWVQLSFVLGCLLLITFWAACIRRLYNIRSLRKHEAAAELENQSRAFEHDTGGRENECNTDEPFGSVAFDKGIKIPGVWASRSNTPEPVNSQSPTLSHLAVPGTFNIDIEMQISNLARSMMSTSPFDHSPRSNHSSRASSSDGRSVVRHPPSSFGKYRIDGQSKSVQEIDEQTASTSSEVGRTYTTSSAEQSSSNISVSKQPLIANTQTPEQIVLSANMYNIRLSQAAETGQLSRFERPSSYASSNDNTQGSKHQSSQAASGQGNSLNNLPKSLAIRQSPKPVTTSDAIRTSDSKSFYSRHAPLKRGEYQALKADSCIAMESDNTLGNQTNHQTRDVVAFPSAAPERKRVSIRQPGFPWFRPSEVEFELVELDSSKTSSESELIKGDHCGELPTTPQPIAKRGRSRSVDKWFKMQKKRQSNAASNKDSDGNNR